jgi:hypothetical protein
MNVFKLFPSFLTVISWLIHEEEFSSRHGISPSFVLHGARVTGSLEDETFSLGGAFFLVGLGFELRCSTA